MTERQQRSRIRYVVQIEGRFYEAPAKPETTAAAARGRGLSPTLVSDRLQRGWDVHKALTEPARTQYGRGRRKGRPW